MYIAYVKTQLKVRNLKAIKICRKLEKTLRNVDTQMVNESMKICSNVVPNSALKCKVLASCHYHPCNKSGETAELRKS